jgi:hypothetical protein
MQRGSGGGRGRLWREACTGCVPRRVPSLSMIQDGTSIWREQAVKACEVDAAGRGERHQVLDELEVGSSSARAPKSNRPVLDTPEVTACGPSPEP